MADHPDPVTSEEGKRLDLLQAQLDIIKGVFIQCVLLQKASEALVDAVLVDEGGLPGQAGHGGLLSRETIAKAHAVQRILSGGGDGQAADA